MFWREQIPKQDPRPLWKEWGLAMSDAFLTEDWGFIAANTNGCGTQVGFFAGTHRSVPNHLLGRSILPACIIHDFDMTTCMDESDKRDADQWFMHNMRVLISDTRWEWLYQMRLALAWVYYKAVRSFG